MRKLFTLLLCSLGLSLSIALAAVGLGKTPLPGRTRINPVDGAEMVSVPGGNFKMGGDSYDCEKPVHVQRVTGFWMYTKPVTNAQFRKFIDANPQWSATRIDRKYDDGEYLKHWGAGYNGKASKGDCYPVVFVSWYAAEAYAEWAGGRLPTEAQWEYAARAGSQFEYGTATGKISHDLANYEGTGGRDQWDGTSPVGSFPPNRFGLYDMAGNVWQWCSSLYDKYPYSATDGREDLQAPGGHVVRGGSWIGDALFLRAADRDIGSPAHCYSDGGFRCVVSSGDP